MNLPIRNFNELYHFGTMNIENRKEYSYEGNTLSVSLHPASWMQIMKQGNDVYVNNNEIKLVDLFEFIKDYKKDVIQWGIDNKIIKEKTIYRLYSYDSEEDRVQYMSFKNREEALKEIDVIDECLETENYDNINNELENYINVLLKKEGYIYTKKGKQNSRQADSVVDMDILASMYLDEKKDEYNIDGCWWNSNLDIDALSAPSGGIFMDKVHLEDWKKIPYKNDCYDEENVIIPDINIEPSFKILNFK